MFAETISLQNQETLLPAFVVSIKKKKKKSQKSRLACFAITKCIYAQTLKIISSERCRFVFPNSSSLHINSTFLPLPVLPSKNSNPRFAALFLPKAEMSFVSENKMVSVSLVGEEIGSRWAGLPTKRPLEPGCPGQPKAQIY